MVFFKCFGNNEAKNELFLMFSGISGWGIMDIFLGFFVLG